MDSYRKKRIVHYCNFCSYSTYYTSHLRSHLCKHTSDRPYKCVMCEQGFSQKFNLINHMKNHSGPKDTLVISLQL